MLIFSRRHLLKHLVKYDFQNLFSSILGKHTHLEIKQKVSTTFENFISFWLCWVFVVAWAFL